MIQFPTFIRKAEQSPRSLESAFPPFNPQHKYRGVYERAGFDVNKNAYCNNKLNNGSRISPDRPYENSNDNHNGRSVNRSNETIQNEQNHTGSNYTTNIQNQNNSFEKTSPNSEYQNTTTSSSSKSSKSNSMNSYAKSNSSLLTTARNTAEFQQSNNSNVSSNMNLYPGQKSSNYNQSNQFDDIGLNSLNEVSPAKSQKNIKNLTLDLNKDEDQLHDLPNINKIPSSQSNHHSLHSNHSNQSNRSSNSNKSNHSGHLVNQSLHSNNSNQSFHSNNSGKTAHSNHSNHSHHLNQANSSNQLKSNDPNIYAQQGYQLPTPPSSHNSATQIPPNFQQAPHSHPQQPFDPRKMRKRPPMMMNGVPPLSNQPYYPQQNVPMNRNITPTSNHHVPYPMSPSYSPNLAQNQQFPTRQNHHHTHHQHPNHQQPNHGYIHPNGFPPNGFKHQPPPHSPGYPPRSQNRPSPPMPNQQPYPNPLPLHQQHNQYPQPQPSQPRYQTGIPRQPTYSEIREDKLSPALNEFKHDLKHHQSIKNKNEPPALPNQSPSEIGLSKFQNNDKTPGFDTDEPTNNEYNQFLSIGNNGSDKRISQTSMVSSILSKDSFNEEDKRIEEELENQLNNIKNAGGNFDQIKKNSIITNSTNKSLSSASSSPTKSLNSIHLQQAPPVPHFHVQDVDETKPIRDSSDSNNTKDSNIDEMSIASIESIQPLSVSQSVVSPTKRNVIDNDEIIQPTKRKDSAEFTKIISEINDLEKQMTEEESPIKESNFENNKLNNEQELSSKLYEPGTGPCRSCNQQINPQDKGSLKPIFSKTGELSGQWHRSCFHCNYSNCEIIFNKKVQCYVFKNQPYCFKHYHLINLSTCTNCNIGIEGSCIENDLKQKWHINCLNCSICFKNIKNDYYVLNDSIICENDAKFLIQKQIKNHDGLNVADRIEKRRTRIYHN
ncbi:uncharacterized protein KGF55_002864 [Candida pseudojiufengensis]|uniref:uncharacterized protein n=1 Tax=Candida pseudojiufengensis TaxID=497109 RepID=UPI002225720F|nr:uncharacterized protein KGF55_002864 [Candida pseudojiufengensis]KAI5963072.1 hypothetical protein KGF55_002864 [Candida pseudojiufengensis]